MKDNSYKKSLVIGTIVLFIGAAVIPSISGFTEEMNEQKNKEVPTILPFDEDDYINAFWKFDTGSGNTAYDSSGHDYDGTIIGASWTTGNSSYGLDFDGMDDFVDLSSYAEDKLGFNKTDDLIFSFYFKSSSTDSGIIFGLSNSPTYGYNPGAHIALTSNGSLEFKAWKTSCGIELASSNSYNDGNWHFVKIYYKGITSNPIAEIYVDDELDGIMEKWVCNFYSDQFHRAKIGEKPDESTENFDGVIDEFKIIKYGGGNKQAPPIIGGPTGGDPGVEYDFTFVTDDPEEDEIWLWIDWNDSEIEDWIGPYDSGEEVTRSHRWDEEGEYRIRARSKDIWGNSYSSYHTIFIGNQPPAKPEISGPHYGEENEELTYTFVADDFEENDIKYFINWGDGNTEWTDYYASGEEVTVSHAWNTEGDFEITAKAMDDHEREGDWSDPYPIRIGDEPPDAPNIDGPTTVSPGIEYDYTFVTTDHEGDDVSFEIKWGDGNTEYTGYSPSGEEVIVSHSWDSKGTYTIEARARDTFDYYGDWATLEISVPRSRMPTNPLFMRLLERFPNAFPLLRHLLGL